MKTWWCVTIHNVIFQLFICFLVIFQDMYYRKFSTHVETMDPGFKTETISTKKAMK